MKYYAQNENEVITHLKSDKSTGLSTNEATSRIKAYGENRIPDSETKSIFKILFDQINNTLTYVLLSAILLSVFSDHITDAVIIGILIIINVSIGFYHEYTAEKRINSLKSFIKNKCNVLRNGKEEIIEQSQLVPGDIVLLHDGQAVPADLRIIECSELTAIEASLTGESLPISKISTILNADIPLGDRKNMLYLGTYITTGNAKAIVVGTGLNTELGKISSQLNQIVETKSLFHQRTDKLMKQMITFSVITTIIMLVLLVVRNYDTKDIVQFGFATLISGIPEGLPSVLTILLSIASVRMTKRNALLRNLPKIETLSTVTTIITDKTGTLTQNIMSVNELLLKNGEFVTITGEGWESDGKFFTKEENIKAEKRNEINIAKRQDLMQILEFSAISSEGDVIKKEDGKFELSGYPTEVARYLISKKAGINKLDMQQKYKVLEQIPYNQQTKFKSYLLEEISSKKRIIVSIGGAENILKLCKNFENKVKINDYIENSAIEGYRMQALAILELEPKEASKNDFSLASTKLQNLELLTVIRISDPIRKEVPQAIKTAQSAGIRVLMATGDHIATAFAIAKEAGIIESNADIKEISKYAISQSEIDKLNDKEFAEIVKNLNVYARVTPATKLRIAEILHEQGEIIAMTGDGVNDAPVLKKADIGIAMGLNGTDVAKEASDLLLLDDSFATIIDAIEEGRTVFKNIRQTSLYLITTNFAEHLMLISSFLIGLPLPLLPLQILWLNLVTDGVTDVALATERSYKAILNEKPRKKEEGIITKKDIRFIIFIALLMASISLAFFWLYLDHGVEKARTMAFATMVFVQLFNVINMRSLDFPIYKLGYFTNKIINYALALSVILFLIVIYTPWLKGVFQFEHITFVEMLVVIIASSPILILGELYKHSLHRSLDLGVK
jgi:P-type Ca2+ transporter type 2C